MRGLGTAQATNGAALEVTQGARMAVMAVGMAGAGAVLWAVIRAGEVVVVEAARAAASLVVGLVMVGCAVVLAAVASPVAVARLGKAAVAADEVAEAGTEVIQRARVAEREVAGWVAGWRGRVAGGMGEAA